MNLVVADSIVPAIMDNATRKESLMLAIEMSIEEALGVPEGLAQLNRDTAIRKVVVHDDGC